jgi:hypothetical protein
MTERPSILYNNYVSFRVRVTIPFFGKNQRRGVDGIMAKGYAFTAQHSTAQHSTAQHSTAQLRLILPVYPVKSKTQKTRRILFFSRDGVRLFALAEGGVVPCE